VCMVLSAAWAPATTLMAAAPPPVDFRGADDALAQVQLRLGHEKPYRYVLAYRGPLLPFRGPVCYAFAGYNETCVDLRIDWLTPATDIELYAPGGVPRELLTAYVMEVRYPALSERTFRYALSEPTRLDLR
jgi:hypothetical protein